MMMKAILVIFALLTSPFSEIGTAYAQNSYLQSIEVAPPEPQSNTLPKLDGSNANKNLAKEQQRYKANQHNTDNIPQKPALQPEREQTQTQTQKQAEPPAAIAEQTIPKADFKSLREDRTDRVTEIIDPLTLRLENAGIVRLVGLDIPDFNPYQPGVIAESTATILRDMLLNRRVKLYQTSDKSTGRTNRLQQKLYHVVIEENESWVQGVLVQLGLARVRTDKSNPEMAQELYILEQQARAAGLGLWSKEENRILSDVQAENFVNSFQIVEGTVMSAARKQNNIYLNFGQDWRKDFTVSIPSNSLQGFNKGNMNPLDLNGKKIRVRGWIGSYNGPYIDIDHPEAIEIL